MDEEAAEFGADAADTDSIDSTDSTPLLQSSADLAARDLEFGLFYLSDMPSLVGFLIVQGARPSVAADVAQEAMTAAYRKWDTIDSPRAWVRTVAARTWWRRAERDRSEVPHEELPEHGLRLLADQSDEIVNRHTFLSMIQALPVSQRQVMAWVYDDYKPTEIAAVLGKPAATVRSLIRDARATLKERYRSQGEAS